MLLVWLACHPDPDPGTTRSPGGGDDPVEASGSTVETGTAPATGLVSGAEVRVHLDVGTVLVVEWQQDLAADEVWLSWSFEGVDHRSPGRAVEAGPAREVVLGLPAFTSAPLVLHAVRDGAEQVVDLGTPSTGGLPSDLDGPTLVTHDPARARTEPWLLTSVDVGPTPFFGPCYTVVLDLQGRIVWYRPTSDRRLTWQPRVARTGDYLLIDESTTYTFTYPGPPTVSRVTLDLERDEPTALDGMMIAYDELEDGSFVFDENVDGVQFYLTRQHPDGTRERVWDCLDWMSPWSSGTWDCATNTTLYSPERNSVLWSTFETSTVVEIDLATGDIVRQLGEVPGGYTFDPPGSRVELQHFPNWTADGTLIVSTHSPDGTEQWAREFALDDAAGTATQIWGLRSRYWAQYAGQAQKLPSGNVLWQLGVTGVIHELTPEGDVVWQVEWPGHLVGNTTPIADLYPLTDRHTQLAMSR